MIIEKQNCLKCGNASDTKIVCDSCRQDLTPYLRKKMDTVYQRTVVEMFGNECCNCGHSAETDKGELCADHLDTKGSTPEGRYDLANACCRCLPCHNKRGTGEIERVPKKEKIPKETEERTSKTKKAKCNCRPGCSMIPLANGHCLLSQKNYKPPLWKSEL